MSILAPCLAALAALSLQGEPVPGLQSSPDRIRESVLPAHYLEGHLDARSIPQAMLEQDIPGLGMAFIEDGEIAWQMTFGYADLATAAPVTPDTVFAAASLSKPVAAMMALHLVDRGALSLDADVDDYLHDWQIPASAFTAEEPVTLRRLVGHTAGIANHLWSAYDPGEPLPSIEAMLTGAPPSVDPPAAVEAVPGARYRYSNPGYAIIQKLVQDATGEDFQTAAERIVFSPAGMTRSTFAQPAPPALNAAAATGYSNALQPYPDRLFPFLAAGGMWSTPGDLARFMGTLMEDRATGAGRILSPELAAEVFAHSEGRLGFTRTPGADGEVLVEHWGSNAGFTSYMVGHLPGNQALVVMTNSDNGFNLMASIARSVAHEYGWPLLEPTVYTEAGLPAADLQRFAGTYGDGLVFSVADGALTLTAPGDAAAQTLVPVGPATLISPSQNTTYQFIEANDGAIRWVRMTQGSGYNNDFPRN
ncbi:MAG: penicillin-binding protein [Oceanicaulis sp.]|uniref:Beta-lactamase-related domain-containing protein n=1 Tax=Maricaulis virginensis TaxID=144022 RepID=A0A9W6MQ03_9PROT|nr:serine hydrolase domain-containing protein [Maricaulis virginensis]MAC39835.1 penicillin-binding protein [Oceanicaulis sp.]MAZ90927.1 penicillin-binding protein [Maricaulis sp.]MBI75713.1 penicillin-binding protein [Oceanicaulis sp.]GLK53712.1 hypothetical protein GCM10017621_32200 [Maricaulis virginensis]